MAKKTLQQEQVITRPSLQGNTATGRPTKTNPIACDCCDKPTDYFNSQRSEISHACGMLPYVVCHACLQEASSLKPDTKRTRKFVIRRAARFGIQWEEAVKAQLGWSA